MHDTTAPVGGTAARRAGAHVIGVAATSPAEALSDAVDVIQRLTDLAVNLAGEDTLRVAT